MTSAMSLGALERTVGRDGEARQRSIAHISGHGHMDNRRGQTLPRFGAFLMPQGRASESLFKGRGPEPFGSGSWPHNLTLVGFFSRRCHLAQSGLLLHLHRACAFSVFPYPPISPSCCPTDYPLIQPSPVQLHLLCGRGQIRLPMLQAGMSVQTQSPGWPSPTLKPCWSSPFTLEDQTQTPFRASFPKPFPTDGPRRTTLRFLKELFGLTPTIFPLSTSLLQKLLLIHQDCLKCHFSRKPTYSEIHTLHVTWNMIQEETFS